MQKTITVYKLFTKPSRECKRFAVLKSNIKILFLEKQYKYKLNIKSWKHKIMKADPIWLSMPVIYPWVWVCGWCWCVHARPIQTLACRPSEWSEYACMAVMSRLLRLVHLVPGLQPYSPRVLPILHCPAWKLHFLAVGILANQPSPVVSHTHAHQPIPQSIPDLAPNNLQHVLAHEQVTISRYTPLVMG